MKFQHALAIEAWSGGRMDRAYAVPFSVRYGDDPQHQNPRGGRMYCCGSNAVL